MGEERIVFGSDAVWYGSPQWQIEAFWRFEIPDELREVYGYPKLTKGAKRKILGLNRPGCTGCPRRAGSRGTACTGRCLTTMSRASPTS